MKKNAILMVAMFIFATVAYGQNAPAKTKPLTPEEKATKMTEKMKKELTLTADQEAKVKDINLQAAKRKEEIKKQAKEDREAIKKSEAQKDADLQKVLTPAQFTKYQQMKEEKKLEKKDDKKKEEMKGEKGQEMQRKK